MEDYGTWTIEMFTRAYIENRARPGSLEFASLRLNEIRHGMLANGWTEVDIAALEKHAKRCAALDGETYRHKTGDDPDKWAWPEINDLYRRYEEAVGEAVTAMEQRLSRRLGQLSLF